MNALVDAKKLSRMLKNSYVMRCAPQDQIGNATDMLRNAMCAIETRTCEQRSEKLTTNPKEHAQQGTLGIGQSCSGTYQLQQRSDKAPGTANFKE